MTKIVEDANGHELQAITPGAAHKITIGASSVRNATAFNTNTKLAMIHSDVPFYYKTGDSSVAATDSDHHLPAGAYVGIGVDGHTHIAVIQDSGAGTLWITEGK